MWKAEPTPWRRGGWMVVSDETFRRLKNGGGARLEFDSRREALAVAGVANARGVSEDADGARLEEGAR